MPLHKKFINQSYPNNQKTGIHNLSKCSAHRNAISQNSQVKYSPDLVRMCKDIL